MKNYRWLIPITLLALALLFIVPTDMTGAQGPPYHINQWTYGASAGGTSTSTSYLLHGTLGQQAVSSSAGLTSTVTGGIWRGVSSAAANILVLEKEYRNDTYPVQVGDELTFIVAVTNNGDQVQEQVVVSDTVPAGLSLVNGSIEAKMGTTNVDGDTVTLSIEQLTYQQIAILTYRTTVDAGTEGQTITNTVTAASTAYGPITATVVVHVWGGGDIHTLYLPLVARNHSAGPSQPVHDLTDAPDACPGYPVIVGELYRDDWDIANDNDWYSFEVVAGQTYVIQTSDLEANTDTLLVLCDDDCSTILAENDDVFWPTSLASRIIWTAPADGVYHAMVRAYNWKVFGADTGYTFGVSLGEAGMGMEAGGSESAGCPKPPPPPTPTPPTP
jgi:uncharacterized repeat protein (TIGR01451 family)